MARTQKVQVYEGNDGKWWWRHVAANGQEIGRSEQGYVRRYYTRTRAAKLHPGVRVEVVA